MTAPIYVFDDDALHTLATFPAACTNKDEALRDVARYALACREALRAFGERMWSCREDGHGIYCHLCSADLRDGVVDGVFAEDNWLKTGHYLSCPYKTAAALLPAPPKEAR